MFYECKSLKKFSVLSKDELKNKKISKEEPINSKLDNVNTSEYDSLDEQLSNKLSSLNKTINKSKQTDKNNKIFIFSSDINKPHFTFILSSNKNIAGDKKSQMNQIIFQSKNFLYNSSFDFNLFQNNSQEYTQQKLNVYFQQQK
jgi:hypothetical protein